MYVQTRRKIRVFQSCMTRSDKARLGLPQAHYCRERILGNRYWEQGNLQELCRQSPPGLQIAVLTSEPLEFEPSRFLALEVTIKEFH
jgi:hypothetical protein